MASKTMVTPQKEETLQKEETREKEGPETPLLELIRSAKRRGYVTHDQISSLLTSEQIKSERIEDLLAKLNEVGVNVIETERSRA